ncbi:MAG TPA: PAS domain-containing protein, partial [Allocoleopsis sp.]
MSLYQEPKLNQEFQSDFSDSDLDVRDSSPREQILVVDDTSANLKLVSDFLIEAGFRVRAAKSGIQALKLLERASPDLILLDVMMPEMDGFETCRRLKDWEKTRDIPVIFMTAVVDSSEPTYKVKGLTLGAVDYISKPIQLEEVLARVKTHLRLRSLTQQLQSKNRRLSEEIEVRRQTEEQLRLLERAIAASSNGIIISDPHQPNNPVIYANSGFERITGYKPDEVIGKNCRFLQGVDTNQPALDELRRAMKEGIETQVILRNYRKDGTLFWNEFCLSPVRDAGGRLTHFIGVQTDITERQRREEALRLIVEGTAATTGEEFFRCCTRYLAQVLQVRYAFLTQRIKGSTTKVRTLAFWTGEDFGENFEYELAGTPCEPVFLGASVHYPEGVQADFPDDKCLVEFGIEGFLGIPLISTVGDILGHLAVMHTSRLENDPDKALILRIFAARAGAELERQRAEEEIRFLLSTTQAIAGAENFDSALSLMLDSCCNFIHWDFGEAWIPSQDGTHLEYAQSTCTQILHHPPNPPYQGGNKNQTSPPLNQGGNKHQMNSPLNQGGNQNQMNSPLNKGGWGGKAGVTGVNQDSQARYECTKNTLKSQIPHPQLPDPVLEEFRCESCSVTFAPGAGLPGRIWSSQQPEWLEDFSQEPSQLFGRHEIATAVGFKAGFGIPILVNDQVLAILVFFKREATPLQPHLLEVIQAIATQVASLIGRKRVEEQLRQSEERWQLALNGNNDGVWDWNINTNQTFRSARFMEILGYEEHEMGTSNDEWVNHIHPDDAERVMRANQNYLERKTPYYAIEHRLRCRDGNYKWVLSRGQAQWDETGKPIRMVGSTSDITPRKMAEEKLRASEARLAEAQRVAHVGNWEFDLLTQKIIWSEEMFRIFGLNPTQPEPTLEEHIQQILPEDRVLWRKTVARALKSGTSYKADFRILRPDRRIRYIEARGKAVVNEQGQVIKLFGTALDITERKQIEAEIIRSKDLLASIFNESADALFLANPETGLITDCNQRAVQLFEVNTKDELLNIEGQALQKEQFNPEDLSSIGDEIERKGIWSRELEYVTKTGKLFWGNLAAKPIQVAGQTINLVRVSDITDRK